MTTVQHPSILYRAWTVTVRKYAPSGEPFEEVAFGPFYHREAAETFARILADHDGQERIVGEPLIEAINVPRWADPNDLDPDEHAYDGDGTSACRRCLAPMNAHATGSAT